MSEDRLSLEDALYRRAGQLAAHFGRYDMYALMLENMLYGSVLREHSEPKLSVASRGASISRLLRSEVHSEGQQLQFCDIDKEMQIVFDRNQIRAANAAILPQSVRLYDATVIPLKRDWFDHDDASDDEVLGFIAQMENDIVKLASLYLRVAAFANQISAPSGARIG